VIDLLPEQKEVRDMGGTMRLGADPVKLHDHTRVREIYGEPVIYERHRHRYEVNNTPAQAAEQAGLVFSGTSPDDRLVEVIELPSTPSSWPRSTTRSSSRARCAPTAVPRVVGAAMERAGERAPEVSRKCARSRGPRRARLCALRESIAPQLHTLGQVAFER